MLLNLEDFTQASSIDLNMVYYHIELSLRENSCVLLYSRGERMSTETFLWMYVISRIYLKRKYQKSLKVLTQHVCTYTVY